MTEYRFRRRLFIAAGALALAAIACGPIGGPPPITPTYTPGPAPIVTDTATPVPPAEPCNPPAGPSADWLVYCSEAYGFSFRYPPGGSAPGEPGGHGRIYLPIVEGTNLLEKSLEVTTTEGATTCESPNAAGYAPGVVPSETVTFNGIDFYKQSGADAGAGSFYEWEAYSVLRGELCVSLGFLLHSTNPGNYQTPPPEFDKAAESAVFGQVMSTFDWPEP